jgi:hypothetical protein
MQLSRLKPETRKLYMGKKVNVKHVLFTGEAVLKSFHNSSMAVIEFDATPVRKQSHFQQRGKLNTLTVDVKNLHI